MSTILYLEIVLANLRKKDYDTKEIGVHWRVYMHTDRAKVSLGVHWRALVHTERRSEAPFPLFQAWAPARTINMCSPSVLEAEVVAAKSTTAEV